MRNESPIAMVNTTTCSEYKVAYANLHLFNHLDMYSCITGRTKDSECEAAKSLLSSCICSLTGVCPSITCESYVNCQDVFIVDFPTIVPFYFTWSIWTGPGVAEWCSIR